MRTYAVVIAVFVLCAGMSAAALAADMVPAPMQPTPAPGGAAVPLPSVTDLVNVLKGANEDDAHKAMDALVAKGEEAIPPLMDLQASGDVAGAERATDTLKRIGCVDGLYATIKLFRSEFAPFETIGVRFYFRNFSRNIIVVFNPVSASSPETNYGYGWKMTLKTADGKKVDEMDMNAGASAAQMGAMDFITLMPAGLQSAPQQPMPMPMPVQYGDRYDDIVYASVLFGVDKIDMGAYVLEGEYYCKPDVAQEIKKLGGLNIQTFFEKSIVTPPVKFVVAVPEADNVPPEKAAEIKKDIADLGSTDFETWTHAENSLGDAGNAALPFLKEAVNTATDPQIRYKAQQLMDKIVQPLSEKIPYLGVRMNAADGVMIQSVMPDSPASEGGLMANDIIVRLGDHVLMGAIEPLAYLRKYVRSLKEGDKLQLTILRQGAGEKTLEITVKKIEKVVFE